MELDKEIQEMLNRFLQELFSGNARIDNLYYNLQYKGYNNLADAIHEPVAHVMGEWADEVSDLMDRLGYRPVRYAISFDYDKEYNVKQVFADLLEYFNHLHTIVIKMIDKVDGDSDYKEISIFLDDFLMNKILPFRKQAQEWKLLSEKLEEEMFDMNISRHTHYIGGGVNAL